MYADFKSILKPIEAPEPNPEESYIEDTINTFPLVILKFIP